MWSEDADNDWEISERDRDEEDASSCVDDADLVECRACDVQPPVNPVQDLRGRWYCKTCLDDVDKEATCPHPATI